MDGHQVIDVLDATADAVAAALGDLADWGLAGTRDGQHHSDLAADAAALAVLQPAGLGVLSEESGLHPGAGDVVVVVDPLDGSTNAARGIPWYATSLCAVDGRGPLAALVVDLVRGTRFDAVRGGGARRDGVAISASSCDTLSDAIIGVNGALPGHLGWRQYRALGAAALDLCAVACGVLDGYVDATDDTLAPWDYLGGMLVCAEAGATMVDHRGRDLVILDHAVRRVPVAAATAGLLRQLRTVRGTCA